jgi:hypothetical protein
VHFVVTRLGEVLVPQTDRAKWLGRDHADDLVHLLAELVAGLPRGHRDGDDDTLWFLLLHRRRGCTHGGARRQPVVDEDRDAAFEIKRRPATAIESLAPLEFEPLARRHGFDCRLRYAKSGDVGIHDAYAAARDGAHRVFLMSRYAELSHDEDV